MKLEEWSKETNRYIGRRTLYTSVHEVEKDKGEDFFNPPKRHTVAYINMEMTCPACPMQYEGKVNGKTAYYRDRHGVWSFEIYDGELFESKLLYEKSGASDEVYGYKGMLAAEKRIMKCSFKFALKNPEYKEPFIFEEWMYDGNAIQLCDY